MIYCCIDSSYRRRLYHHPHPKCPISSRTATGNGRMNLHCPTSTTGDRFKVKVQYPSQSSPPADCYSKHMLLEHMATNISTIKQISNSHFEKTEHFMTNTLQLLEKMVENIDNVLNTVLVLEKDYKPSADD